MLEPVFYKGCVFHAYNRSIQSSIQIPKQTNVEIKVAQIEALDGMAQQKIKTNVSLSYLIFETLPIFSVHLPAMPAFLTAFVIFAVR